MLHVSTMILMQQLLSRKLGENIVTVTNNVLHTFLKIFAVVQCLPCFPIIADTGKLIKNFRITKGTFLHKFCLWASTFSYTLTWVCVLDCSTLLYLIKIFKMAAELYKGVFSREGDPLHWDVIVGKQIMLN